MTSKKSHVKRILQTLEVNLARLSISVLLSYFVVTLIITIGVSVLTKKMGKSKFQASNAKGKFRMALLSPSSDYLEMTDAVTSRNLFNSEGKFPERKKKKSENSDAAKVFDENSECKKTKIPIVLVGTIVAGRESMAIVLETGRKESDIYRIGQAIYDYEEAVIHDVKRYEVVINNASVKECLQLKKPRKASFGDDGYEEEPEDEIVDVTVDSKTYRLKSEYVEKALGPGMSRIIEKAKIVPTIGKSGEFAAYKIFAIKGGSLFTKIGLRNNDLIKKVNGTVIGADQGSLLLESFQQGDREIVIEVLSGDKPRTLTVLID